MNEQPDHGITIDLMLGDSAKLLSDLGFRSLARSVQYANTLLSGQPPGGEAFVADIVDALELSYKLVTEATVLKEGLRIDPEQGDDLMKLNKAITRVADWGLEPDHRVGNAIRDVVYALESIRVATSDQAATLTEANNLLTIANTLASTTLDAMGYCKEEDDQDAKASDTEPGT